jgi:hypothetical protein
MTNTLKWLAFAGAVAGGALLGGAGTSLFYRTELAQVQVDHAEAAKRAAVAASARLAEAETRAEALSSALAHTEQTLNHTALEATREIPRVTTGRPCLGPGAVRLLNRGPGAGAGAVPASPGTPAAAGGPAASDTDVAGWIVGAQQQHETCRARLDALITFEEGSPQ